MCMICPMQDLAAHALLIQTVEKEAAELRAALSKAEAERDDASRRAAAAASALLNATSSGFPGGPSTQQTRAASLCQSCYTNCLATVLAKSLIMFAGAK
jgi:hypothetical protein